MNKRLLIFLLPFIVIACKSVKNTMENNNQTQVKGKVVIYQVFTRLFGNTKTTNKPWGTIEENGVGKFADFTDKALEEIKALGATHIWYTGVPHHAVIRDYTSIGISNDDPDVVKGRAGSPYAVKDYYNVNPDLSTDPAKRLDEFKELVDRTQRHGLKVIIDIVPNHVARHYVSVQKPDGVEDFGATDDRNVEYQRDNNFYYIPGQSFQVPHSPDGYKPLGGEPHPMSDGRFDENPAKWTGNGSRRAQPDINDWYETVKINYGVRPDGSKDFDTLPADYANRPVADHYAFWQGKEVPSSWKKFLDIALFWLDKGVDGFRFDMAEMVPVEFWSYMNSAIKTANPSAELIAEIYNPAEYRNYIHLGKMDYLYDKVDFYDRTRDVIQGRGGTDILASIQQRYTDIEHHLLHFLENHDEQRIASPAFAGHPEKAKPGMVVSATISTSPTMIYFGQEVGEPGAEHAGFGSPTRTSIFDYVGVPHHQRWMNGGKFDGGQLSASELDLRDFYKRLLNFTRSSSALMGKYADLHHWNRLRSEGYHDRLFSFARWSNDQKVIVFSNFSDQAGFTGKLHVTAPVIKDWGLKDGSYQLKDELYGKNIVTMQVANGEGHIELSVAPLESLVLSLQ
jgi:glycosidase